MVSVAFSINVIVQKDHHLQKSAFLLELEIKCSPCAEVFISQGFLDRVHPTISPFVHSYLCIYLFVFVYLFICICLFVYLYLCICVSVFTEVFIPQGFLSRVHPSILLGRCIFYSNLQCDDKIAFCNEICESQGLRQLIWYFMCTMFS